GRDLARLEGRRREESRLRGPVRVLSGDRACRRRSPRRRARAHRPAADRRRVDGTLRGGVVIRSRVIGTGSYLPPRVVTNAELARPGDTSGEWIGPRAGVRGGPTARQGHNPRAPPLERRA